VVRVRIFFRLAHLTNFDLFEKCRKWFKLRVDAGNFEMRSVVECGCVCCLRLEWKIMAFCVRPLCSKCDCHHRSWPWFQAEALDEQSTCIQPIRMFGREIILGQAAVRVQEEAGMILFSNMSMFFVSSWQGDKVAPKFFKPTWQTFLLTPKFAQG